MKFLQKIPSTFPFKEIYDQSRKLNNPLLFALTTYRHENMQKNIACKNSGHINKIVQNNKSKETFKVSHCEQLKLIFIPLIKNFLICLSCPIIVIV